MRTSARFWSALGVLVALNSAGWIWLRSSLEGSAGPTCQVLSTLPTRDVCQTDRLSLIFDRPLVAAAVCEAPLRTAPFQVSPPLDGQWVWAEPDRLELRLDAPPPPGRRIALRPAPDFEQQIGRALAGREELVFETGALSLETAFITHGDHDFLELHLEFDQPVSPSELLAHATLTAFADDELELTATQLTPNDELTLRFPRPDVLEVSLTLASVFAGAGADLPLGETVQRRLRIPDRFALIDARAETPGLGPELAVRLRFTEELDAAADQPTIRMTPPVKGISCHHDGRELVLRGAFAPSTTYALEVPATLLAARGVTLSAPARAEVTIESRRPRIAFADRRGILTPHGNRLLDLKAAGVSEIRARLHRVHANNLVDHVRGRGPDETARALAERTFPIGGQPGEVQELALDLGELLGEPLGVYHVELSATDRRWTSDRAIVTVSDLALTVKEQRTGPWVWVTSLRTGEPVPGAEVLAFSYNDQVLARGVTDEEGLTTLEVPREHPDGRPWLVAARLGEDLSFLRPDERRWTLDDVDQSGRPIPEHYDVLVYTERGIYRPGDPIHATAILRDARGETPPPFPIELSLHRPDGRMVDRETVLPGDDLPGLLQASLTTDGEAATGEYWIEASLPGGAEPLARAPLLVEAFVPVRLELTAQATRERFTGDEAPSIDVSARYLIGRPAAGLPVLVTGSWRRMPCHSAAAPAFRFTPPEPEEPKELRHPGLSLDESGSLLLALEDDELPAEPGLWQANVHVTVTEPGSRSVTRAVTLERDSLGRHLGVSLPETVTTEQPFEVHWQLRDGDDRALPWAAVELELVRIERDWTLKKVGGQAVWQPETHEVLVTSKRLEVPSGEELIGHCELRCPEWGRYELRLLETGSGSRTIQRFGTGGRWATSEGGPERLELTLDQTSYRLGQTARIGVRSPFAGTLMLTLETGEVVAHRLLMLTGNEAELDWKLPADLRGGAFFSATLVRPVDPTRTDWLPHRARGLVRLEIDHEPLNVTIDAPALARPGEMVPVAVEIEGCDPEAPTWIHLWAVDTGILLTTDHRVPDPHDHYFAPRRAEVTTADLFGDLLPDSRRAASMDRIGGDRDAARKLRRNLVPDRRPIAAVVWRTARRVEDGRLALDVELPELEGELCWMAVAASADRYGASEQAMTVRSPLSVAASWPRAVSPGDTFEVPITLANQTGDILDVTLALELEGSIEIADIPTSTSVPAGASERLVLEATAQEIGAVMARVVATASRGDEVISSQQRSELTVRPATPIQSRSRVLSIEPGEPVTIELAEGLLPAGRQSRLEIGPTPMVSLRSAYDELLRYPFGCLEQTTSRLFALLLHGRLGGAAAGDDRVLPPVVAERIDAGLRRLARLQLPSGGLAYWPNRREVDVWGSAYAASFLLAARREGLAVPDLLQSDLIQWLEERLHAGNDEPLELAAFLARLLTESDRPPRGWLARLSEQRDRLDIAGRTHLYVAWQILGESERARTLLADGTLELVVPATRRGRLTSQVRQEGALLHALAEWEPDHPWVPVLVQRLESARREGSWSTTLENAAALQALTRWSMQHRLDSHYTGRLVTSTGDVYEVDSQKTHRIELPSAANSATVTLEGRGDAWLIATSEGLAAEAAEEMHRQLRVSRRWLNAAGEPIDSAALRTGDLVIAEIRLSAPGLDPSEELPNVAVVDLLPGGLEPENPRLRTADGSGARLALADRVELQDDRVVLFTAATRRERLFQYPLRAVTAGDFALPAVQASCMYDPAFASVSGAGRCRVSGMTR